jgi:capsular exopolysaccharide synthesis family protein
MQLRELQQRRSLKTILVTSTVPEEGKSFVSANLALTLAREREQKVLLVDGDVRRPVLSTNLGVGNHPGLREWLGRNVSLSNTIHHIEDLGLWFLPAGDARNPVESIQSGQLAETLDPLSPSFDWIIIDSPPLLPLADASVWCRVVDGVLFVTREGTTKKRELKRGIEMLDKSSIIGVVVNDCRSADLDNRYERYVRQLNDSKDEW